MGVSIFGANAPIPIELPFDPAANWPLARNLSAGSKKVLFVNP
jgi:hypothetical protein